MATGSIWKNTNRQVEGGCDKFASIDYTKLKGIWFPEINLNFTSLYEHTANITHFSPTQLQKAK